jgi:hypothetical protein
VKPKGFSFPRLSGPISLVKLGFDSSKLFLQFTLFVFCGEVFHTYRAKHEREYRSEFQSVLSCVGLEEQGVGIGDHVLWKKVERGHVSEAGPRTETAVALSASEIKIWQTSQEIHSSLERSPVGVLRRSSWNRRVVTFVHEVVVATYPRTWIFSRDQEGIAVNIQKQAVPSNRVANLPNRDRALLASQDVVDDVCDRGLAGSARSSYEVYLVRFETERTDFVTFISCPEQQLFDRASHWL